MTKHIDKDKVIAKKNKQIKKLEAKTYGWCNTCGSLIIGDVEHLCDKCGRLDGKIIFDPEFELVRLKEALKRIDDLSNLDCRHDELCANILIDQINEVAEKVLKGEMPDKH